MEELVALWPLPVLALVFWLLVIRPASRRQKEVRQMQDGLEVGQREMLASGIYGLIRHLGERDIRLEIAPGVEIDVVRAAVAQGAEEDEEAVPPPEEG